MMSAKDHYFPLQLNDRPTFQVLLQRNIRRNVACKLQTSSDFYVTRPSSIYKCSSRKLGLKPSVLV
jgi:hypothetical protein